MRTILRAALALVLAVVLVGGAIRFVVPQLALAIALDIERARSGVVARSVTLPDGLRMAYLEGGRGETLVLLHGFGADKDNFTPIARHLVRHFRVVVPDLVGFGDSSRPADADYSPVAQAERLSAFLRAIGVASANVGGSSMGGQIALTWATLRPAEVQSLWLLAPAGIWSAPASEAATIFRSTGRNPMLVASEAEFDTLLSFVMKPPHPTIPRFLQDVFARRRVAARPLEERIFAHITADSIESRVAGLKKQTLIVFGQDDRVIAPSTAPILRRLLPRSHIVVMPGVGHLPALEQPERAASDFVRFHASL